MFCRKCGKQIKDESKFCEFCGAPVILNEPHKKTDRKNEEQSFVKRKWYIVVIVALTVVLIIALVGLISSTIGFESQRTSSKKEVTEADDSKQNETEADSKEKDEEEKKVDYSYLKNAKGLTENYYIIGEELKAGLYDIGPAEGDTYFSISVYDNMKYFKESPDAIDYGYDGDGDSYIDHERMYYGEEIKKGIKLKKGNVLVVDYRGIRYKKQ